MFHPPQLPIYFEHIYGDLRREIDRYLGGPDNEHAAAARIGSCPIDMREDDRKVYIHAELPGFHKDDISVTLHEGELVIEAKRADDAGEDYFHHLRERRFTNMRRRQKLPAEVDESSIEAAFEDGLLRLEMIKRPGSKQHHIEIM